MAGNKKPKRKPSTNGKAALIQRQRKQTVAAMKDNYIAFLAKEGEALRAYNRKGGHINFSEPLQKSIEKTPILWRVTGYVISRDHTGGEYMKEIEVDAPFPCLRGQVKQKAADAIFKFMKEDCNANHILGVGWIATHADNEIDNEIADKIFTHFGVWKEFAGWQYDKAVNGEL